MSDALDRQFVPRNLQTIGKDPFFHRNSSKSLLEEVGPAGVRLFSAFVFGNVALESRPSVDG